MKKLLMTVLSLALAATIAISGTVAYFTDTEEAVNVMTMGKVDIELIEQQRAEDGSLIDFDADTAKKLMPLVGDITNAAKDANDMPTGVKNFVDKIVSVTNKTDSSDAFVRLIIGVPAELDNNGALHLYEGTADFSKEQLDGTVSINGIAYNTYVYTHNTVVEAGSSTTPAMRGFYLDSLVDWDANTGNYMINGTVMNYSSTEVLIPVLAQAVQVDGFENNMAGAFEAAFGKLSNANNPFNNVLADNWDGEEGDANATLATDSTGAYLIQNAEDLAIFAAQVNAGNTYAGKTVKLTTNINLNNEDWTPIGAGNSSKITSKFKGTFDGQDHTISNLKISESQPLTSASAGLFGTVEGTIRRVKLSGVKINWTTSGANGVAALVGTVHKGGTIENVHVSNVEINSNHYTGGIVGYANCTDINNCSVKKAFMTVLPNGVAGGKWDNGDKVGGIAGLVSETNSIITNNHAEDVTITAYRDMGGIVGAINLNKAGVVLKNNTANGITLNLDRSRFYEDKAKNWDGIAGSLIGGGTAYDSSNVASEVTKNEVSTGPDTSWFSTDATEFILSNKDQVKGFAYLVNNVGQNFDGKTVKLGASIDLGGDEWTPIGQTGSSYGAKAYFQGDFDGQGNTISNFKITQTNPGGNYAAGFFGFLDCGQTGTIKNLTIDRATIYGHHWVGGVAGFLSGTMEKCHVTNSAIICTHANGDACGDKAGAVVGYINGTQGKMINCTASASTVKAGRDAGQVVGTAPSSQVEGCSATSVTVSATGDCTGANIRNEVIGRLN